MRPDMTTFYATSKRIYSFIAILTMLAVSASAQTLTLAPPPFQTFLDNSGRIVNLGCVWTYVAGTLTTVDTYSTSGGTLNANPIITDSAGRFTVYLSPGNSYKFVYESPPCSAISHGATVKTADNILAIPASGQNTDIIGTAGENIAAGGVVYLSDGSGALVAGKWYNADADLTYASSTAAMVGIAPDACANGSTTCTIRVGGRVTGLSTVAGDLYYVSATAGGMTTTPPANQWFIGKADSNTSIIISQNQGGVRLPDTTGAAGLVFRNAQALTADASVTFATGGFNRPMIPGGRLTLTTGVPVTNTDVTAATTLYYTPYSRGGASISLYDGTSAWSTYALTELSISLPATTSTMYDVWVYDNAGVPTLELTAWTNDTTRATALTTQNGLYVKTGQVTRLYVGSFRTTGVSGQTEDSLAKRYVWNYYNRVLRPMQVLEGTNIWTYTLLTLQQANASAANQLDLVVGVAEVAVEAEVIAYAASDQATGAVNFMAGIGYDSTSAQATGVVGRRAVHTGSTIQPVLASLLHYPAVGRHIYTWLEASTALGTTTWYGDDGATTIQSGIFGTVEN